MLRATTADGRGVSQSWLGLEATRFPELLDGRTHLLLTDVGVLRAVPELPETLSVVLPGAPQGPPVRVLTVDAVERAHPAHAELLARWRQRRTTPADHPRTVGG